jgi:hypothetical protein
METTTSVVVMRDLEVHPKVQYNIDMTEAGVAATLEKYGEPQPLYLATAAGTFLIPQRDGPDKSIVVRHAQVINEFEQPSTHWRRFLDHLQNKVVAAAQAAGAPYKPTWILPEGLR